MHPTDSGTATVMGSGAGTDLTHRRLPEVTLSSQVEAGPGPAGATPVSVGVAL